MAPCYLIACLVTCDQHAAHADVGPKHVCDIHIAQRIQVLIDDAFLAWTNVVDVHDIDCLIGPISGTESRDVRVSRKQATPAKGQCNEQQQARRLN